MADETKIDYIAHRLDDVAEKVNDTNTALVAHIAKTTAYLEMAAENREDVRRNTQTLQVNTASLQDHIKRTDLLENYVKKIDARFTPVELEAMRKVAVAEWWKNRVYFMAKLGAAVTALGTIWAVLRFLLKVI